MWNTVVLDKNLASAFVKAAVSEGALTIAKPKTADERIQVADFITEINRSRLGPQVLSYGLLADRIILSNLDRNLYKELDSDDMNPDGFYFSEDDIRPIFDTIWEELDFVQPPDPTYKFRGVVEWHDMPSIRKALEIVKMEPFIWKNVIDKQRRQGHASLPRWYIRDAIDLISVYPDIIALSSLYDISDSYEDIFSRTRNRITKSYYRHVRPDDIDNMTRLCQLLVRESLYAWSRVRTAEHHDGVLPVSGLSFGGDRHASASDLLSLHNHENTVAATRIFLDEIHQWPLVENMVSLVRVRKSKAFKEFRELLRLWVTSLNDPARVEDERKVRAEIGKANRALHRSMICTKVGRWFTYLGVPLIAVDALLTGGLAGAAVTVVGFGVQAAGDLETRGSRWALVGRN